MPFGIIQALIYIRSLTRKRIISALIHTAVCFIRKEYASSFQSRKYDALSSNFPKPDVPISYFSFTIENLTNISDKVECFKQENLYLERIYV